MLLALLLAAQAGSVQFVTSAAPDTVYVGQQVSYDGSLRISALAPPRFLESPEYTPPDVKGVMTYTFPFDTATSIREVTAGGVRYTQYTYHRALFPLAAGTDTIPPSLLSYTLLDEADPYASRRAVRRGAPAVIVALPLPAAGRPHDFSGAVGQFTITATAESIGLRTGSGFVVRVSVAGTGNVPLLQRPTLAASWATVATTSESVGLDLTGTLVRGFKEFRWLLTPRVGGRLEIPPIRFSYFDPAAKSYRTAATVAIPLTIVESAPASAAATQDDRSATALPLLTYTVAAVLVLVCGAVIIVAGARWRARRTTEKAHSSFDVS